MILTEFQLKIISNIENREDFKHFVTVDGRDVRDTEDLGVGKGSMQPYIVLWYDKENELNLWRIGVRRLLYTHRSAKPKSRYPEHVI